MHIIDNFSWITFDVEKIGDMKIYNELISDYSRMSNNPIGLYGVTPSVFDASLIEYL